ncbi:MAG: molybdopterin-dependent oxidoreductase [Pseudomonadota bacterium]
MPTLHRTTCAHDCPGSCALLVEIEGDQLLSVRGDPAHALTRGVICGKVRRYAEIVDGPRVARPLLREGPKGSGRFREATWDDALQHIVDGLERAVRAHGASSVLPYYYGGTLGLVQQKAIERLAHRAGWSRLERSLCFAIADAGWSAGVGRMLGPRPEEIAHSDLVLLWGINAVSTHISLMSHVKHARSRGAPLVVVDPYRTRTARLADHHLMPRPGTDAALACGLMHVLLDQGMEDRAYLASRTDFNAEVERHLTKCTPPWASAITGIAVDEIVDLARRYGRAQRPFIRIGVGMTRHRNGAVNLHAVSCLPSLVGAWPKHGAGALIGTDAGFSGIVDERVRGTRWRDPGVRSLDMSQLGRWLCDPALAPPVAALLVFNANPAVSCPDLGTVHQGLQREDLFTVVHEQVMTDTARLADVVLPATTFLEHDDLYRSYGHYSLQLGRAVLTPRGEARCNHDVVNALAQRLGHDDDLFAGDSLQRIDQVLAASGLPDRGWFETHGPHDVGMDEDVLHFRTRFPTRDGRFHFMPGWSDSAMPRLPDHWAVNARDVEDPSRTPLDFMAPPGHEVLNSTFTQTATARRRHAPPTLLLHPVDAAARNIVDGDTVRVYNARASLVLRVHLTDDVTPGLCLCETNHLGQDFPGGMSVNALVDAARVAPGGGPAFHDNRVQVSRLAPGAKV